MSAKYPSLHNHISSNKNATNGEFISSKKIFFSREVQKGVKEIVHVIAILLQCGEGNIENPYSQMMIEKVWS